MTIAYIKFRIFDFGGLKPTLQSNFVSREALPLSQLEYKL